MHGPAPARLDDPARALVERLQRPARRLLELHQHAAPRGGEQPQLQVAQRAARVAHAAADDHDLDAQALGLAGVAVDDRAGLLGLEVDLRPHVEPHAVPQQPLARGAAGLEAPQRLERLGEHVLELGQADDAAAVVAHHAQRPHLGQREQPLVLGVRAAAAVEEVDVRRGRDALEHELGHPPQVQPLAHLGVDALQVAVERPAAVEPALQRDRVRRGHAARRRGHVEHDALHAAAACRRASSAAFSAPASVSSAAASA